MYINKLTTNVKLERDIELGERTLIIGANGSGKTAILNSVELCMAGYVSDYRGKVVKQPRDLLALTNNDELKVAVSLSTGQKCSVRVKRNASGTVSRPKYYGKTKLNLPMKEVSDALEGSSKTFTSWLLKKMSVSLDQELFLRICEENEVQASDFDLNNLIANIDDEVAALKQQVNAKRDFCRTRSMTIEEFRTTLESDIDMEAGEKLADLQHKIAEHHSLRNMLTRTSDLQHRLEERYAHTDLELSAIQHKLDAIRNNQHLLATAEEVMTHNICKELISVLELHENIEASGCMVCDGHLTNVDQRITTLRGKVEDAANKIQLLRIFADLESAERDTLAELESIQQQVRDVRAEVAPHENRLRELGPFNEEEIEVRETQLKDAVQKADFYRARLREIERVKQELDLAQQDLENHKNRLKALQVLQSNLVDAAKDKFITSLNAHLPFQVQLQVDEKNIHLSKLVDGASHLALSGAEYLQLKFALCEVIAEEASVILSEDKALDDKTLCNLLETLSTFSHQVLLTSTFRPSNIPEEWVIIEL